MFCERCVEGKFIVFDYLRKGIGDTFAVLVVTYLGSVRLKLKGFEV